MCYRNQLIFLPILLTITILAATTTTSCALPTPTPTTVAATGTVPPPPLITTEKEKGYYESQVELSTVDISEPFNKYFDAQTGKGGGVPLRAWPGLLLKTFVFMYYGIRIDYLLDVKGYLNHHAVYYFTWIGSIIAADTILNYRVDWNVLLNTPLKANLLLVASFATYYVGFPIYFTYTIKWLDKRYGKAKLIQISEIVCSVKWLIVTTGARAYMQTIHKIPFPSSITPTLTNILGYSLMGMGAFFKGWSCCLTGYNSYFYRDMIIQKPNTHFVQSSLYKITNHPTYTLGYLQILGAAILWRSVEGILIYVLYQLGILYFAHTVEAKFIHQMYPNNNNNGDNNDDDGVSLKEPLLDQDQTIPPRNTEDNHQDPPTVA